MKICAISDLHGNLPEINQDCDAILLAGDICCHGKAKIQLEWLDNDFRAWLNKVNKPVFAVAGNHDWAMYMLASEVKSLNLPWTYLQDEWAMFKGLKIYGTPHTSIFLNWAFMLSEHGLMGKWNIIPDDIDILICHSPPKFYGDKVAEEFLGSESLLWRIQQVKPNLVVFGHIHEGRGEWRMENTILSNVTIMNAAYVPIYQPWSCEVNMDCEQLP